MSEVKYWAMVMQQDYDALAGDLAETRIALANAECRERAAKARLAEAERLRDKYGAALESLIAPDGDFHYSSSGTDWVLSVLERGADSADEVQK